MQKIITLKKRAEFLTVRDKGVSAPSPAFIIQLFKTPDNNIRVGYTVSKKIGNSVERNRIKRRFRAAAGKILPRIAGGKDIVLIGRKPALTIPFAKLLIDLEKAVKKLDSQVHPKAD